MNSNKQNLFIVLENRECAKLKFRPNPHGKYSNSRLISEGVSNKHTFGAAMGPTSDNVIGNFKAEQVRLQAWNKDASTSSKNHAAVGFALPTIGRKSHWGLEVTMNLDFARRGRTKKRSPPVKDASPFAIKRATATHIMWALSQRMEAKST